jgi:hypothetical protein
MAALIRFLRFRAPKAFALTAASLAASGVPVGAHAQAQASKPCTNPAPPPGAQSLGYDRLVFCETPSTSDISFADTGSSSKLYAWGWYSPTPSSKSLYSMAEQTFVIDSGGGVTTETHRSQPGAVPLLLAGAGFYVEFAERLSDNDPDHFPAVWLMPQEHNLKRDDHMPGDPPGYERWMELDVDEGGYNQGHLGTMINWWGQYPQYEHKNFGNAPPSTFGMDRTQDHVFGLSYDPAGKKATWWVDGANVGSVSTEPVPLVVNSYHYYLIISAQNHKLNHPYKIYVSYFSAWSKAVPPKAPAGVKAEPVP